MPSGTHTIELDLPIEKIWSFVSNMDNWAPLVPGYMEHQILSENESTWKFKGDLGFMQKVISLKITITEWQEPSKVSFKLKGINENFSGDGFFEAEALSDSRTKMTGSLDISAGGMMGAMVNPVLKTFVPKVTKELTEATADRILELETVRK